MQISFAFIIMKNCAEAGYIFNIHKLIEISKLLPKGNIPLFKWIPIINIMCMFKIGKIYIDNIDEYINQLHIQGIIDKMTPEQIKEYEEKPNSLNSYIMAIKNDDTIKNFKNKFTENKTKNDNTYFVVIQDKESHKLGLIVSYVDENGEINIIKTAGFASSLTYEEQKKCVISYLKRKIMRIVNKYNNAEE